MPGQYYNRLTQNFSGKQNGPVWDPYASLEDYLSRQSNNQTNNTTLEARDGSGYWLADLGAAGKLGSVRYLILPAFSVTWL